jgi:hypothetical protein
MLSAIRSGNKQQFQKMLSRDYVVVAYRDYDFGSNRWHESITICRYHNLTASKLARLIRRFRIYLSDSYENRKVFLRSSLSMRDAWGRHVGPAIEGKVVSGEYWYIRFVIKHAQWKAYRFEHAIHAL